LRGFVIEAREGTPVQVGGFRDIADFQPSFPEEARQVAFDHLLLQKNPLKTGAGVNTPKVSL
tara:strand:+ start:1086 stop:1271 length:186 start_codon:yes stop_codon:yes gene_type:complete